MHLLPLITRPPPMPRADRHIQQAGKSLARSHRMFRQRGCVHVRVDARRHAKRLLKRIQQRIVDPFGLGGLGDPAVGRRSRVQVERTERADAQRHYIKLANKIHDLRNRHIRRQRRETCPLQDTAFRISD